MAKSYQLVAWTGNGQVHMLPSLQQDSLQKCLDTIAHSKGIPRIKAHERYADTLLSFGHTVAALSQYAKAAGLCLCCPDQFWADSDYGSLLCRPYSSLFFGIFGKCRQLLRSHPELRDTRAWKELESDYREVTTVDRGIKAEFDEAWNDFKAWHFAG